MDALPSRKLTQEENELFERLDLYKESISPLVFDHPGLNGLTVDACKVKVSGQLLTIYFYDNGNEVPLLTLNANGAVTFNLANAVQHADELVKVVDAIRNMAAPYSGLRSLPHKSQPPAAGGISDEAMQQAYDNLVRKAQGKEAGEK